MDSPLGYVRQKIKRRIQALLFTGIALIVAGTLFVMWNGYRTIGSYDADIGEIREKLTLISRMAEESDEIILRARGYYVYLDQAEYEAIFAAREELQQTLVRLRELPIDQAESALADKVERFFQSYFQKTLPTGVQLAQKRDLETLRELVYQDGVNPVNEILSDAHQAQMNAERQLEQKNGEFFRKLSGLATLLIGYIAVVLLLLISGSRQLGKDISKPLGILAGVADRQGDGSDIPERLAARPDEIGLLSRSFRDMLRDIRDKEDELSAQNEELMAQQDELQAQHLQLQAAIGKMEENEAYLKKMNSFSRSLSQTFDKQELLENTIRQLTTLSGMEKGLIVLPGHPPVFAAYGIDGQEARAAADSFLEGGILRALQSGKPYIRGREASAGERAVAGGPVRSYDIFLPVLNERDGLSAGIMMTRVGLPVETKEVEDLAGYASQISLAIGKIEMFESAEGQRQMVRNILDTIHEGVQVMDLDGRIVQINAKMREILESKADLTDRSPYTWEQFMEFVGRNVKNPDKLRKFIEEALSGRQPDKSLKYEILSEPSKIMEIYHEPLIRNGVFAGTLLVHRDISVEFEVDRMKSEFVSTVSHELRTPLSGILGFAELMLHRELPPERQRKYVATIHREAVRLTDLINDFLDLQRMESGKQAYDRKPVDLIPLLKDVIRIQQASTKRHQLLLDAGSGAAQVTGDEDKLRQVFVNLVNNAVKYSPEGGRVDVRCMQADGLVRVEVQDEGLGIPENARAALFEKFYRVDNSDRREIGGTGLGLAIVKEILDQHEGAVEVQSVLGGGSTFTVTLPSTDEQYGISEAAAAAD